MTNSEVLLQSSNRGMVHKTRKHTAYQKKGIDSIPELRRAFEHIEQFVDAKLAKKESKERISKDLCKEWFKVFHKELKKPAAEAFVHDRSNEIHEIHEISRSRRRTVRKGGSLISLPLTPIDHMTRAGVYLAPGQRPDAQGGLPFSHSGGSNIAHGAPYGSFVQYVDNGFFNPEIAQSYDPVPGQAAWPHPAADMGSNVFKGGKHRSSRRKIRGKKQQGGNPLDNAVASVSHAFSMRHIPSSVPSSSLQDAETWMRAGQLGDSPDQVQRLPTYQLL